MDKSWLYPIGYIMVIGTWLPKVLTRRVTGFPTFEYYQTTKKILHYSHLIWATNIKLLRYKGKPTSRVLWILSSDDHEIIIDALQKERMHMVQ